MAELDPLYEDGLANNLSGQTARLAFASLGPGALGDNDLLVTPGTAVRELIVAAGLGMVPGSTPGVFMQGMYAARNDAPRSSTGFEVVPAVGAVPGTVGPVPAPDATNPRLDQVIARVWDHAADGSGLRKWRLAVVPGVPTAGVTLDNRAGAVADGSMPPNWLRLADVITRPGMTQYPAGDIRDRRARATAGVAGSLELGYAEITSPPPNVGTVQADIAGLAVTVTVRTRPIVVKFGCRAITNGTANGGCVLQIQEGATPLQIFDWLNNPANFRQGIYFETRLNPTPGPHTYKMTWVAAASTTGMIVDSAAAKAWMQVVEV